ncbi:MAG: response regulator [Syntrophales bacterium]|nr:response regulator [Syntrophales bacterium]MDD5640555.1 response regulator [Syntrophales bacterium]
MIDQTAKILLVEDNSGDAYLIRGMLAREGSGKVDLEWVTRLADGLERLGRGGIGIVLLDLGLPDSQGLDTFIQAASQYPQVPIVVLTGLADESVGVSAVRQGAQDYLVKGEVDGKSLLRAIRYATERKRAEEALRQAYDKLAQANWQLNLEVEERRHAQEAAEYGRQNLFAVLNTLPAFVHLKGSDFTIQFANRRMKEIFGEPEHRPCYEVLRDRREPCEHCPVLEVLKTRTPQKFEWTSSLNNRTYEVYHYPFPSEDDLLVLTLGIDITERKEAEKSIRHLTHELMRAQEQEKQKISLELHDTVAQELAALKIGLENLRDNARAMPGEKVSSQATDLLAILQHPVNSIRSLSYNLRPPDLEHLGLVQAIRMHCEEVAARTGLHIDVNAAGVEAARLDYEAAINLYRIVQEGLANARRHSGAKIVSIRLVASHPKIILRLEDDGRGFDVAGQAALNQQHRRMGLLGMKERVAFLGGEMRIESQPNKGTKINIEIPWSREGHGVKEKDSYN